MTNFDFITVFQYENLIFYKKLDKINRFRHKNPILKDKTYFLNKRP